VPLGLQRGRNPGTVGTIQSRSTEKAEKGTTMAAETDEVAQAVAELTHAMTGLVRVIDAKGPEAVASHISDALSDGLDALVARLNAIRGFTS
jgi:predicted dinucleotide-utilizing enzyme